MIILASGSPRRRELLRAAGIKFISKPSALKEYSACLRPAWRVRDLAKQKAEAIAKAYPKLPVLGADTLVYCKGEILGKPKNYADALRMLRKQNGTWQSVYTGIALIWKNRGVKLLGFAKSRCKARAVEEGELKIMASKHLDKAGAYAAQDNGDCFISHFEGDFDTIVGLSVSLVRQFLHQAGIKSNGEY